MGAGQGPSAPDSHTLSLMVSNFSRINTCRMDISFWSISRVLKWLLLLILSRFIVLCGEKISLSPQPVIARNTTMNFENHVSSTMSHGTMYHENCVPSTFNSKSLVIRYQLSYANSVRKHVKLPLIL